MTWNKSLYFFKTNICPFFFSSILIMTWNTPVWFCIFTVSIRNKNNFDKDECLKQLKIRIKMEHETNTGKNAKHHMGQMIKAIVKERNMPVSDFAKAIHCCRTNVYSIFKRWTIDIDKLKQIADVLNLEISDFIETKKRKSSKCVAIIEIDNEKLEQMSNEYELTYVKSWKTK